MLLLAGCAGDEESAEAQAEEERPEDWCLAELEGPVVEEYRTAESIDGIQRDPSDLTSKSDAVYQCHREGLALCANCRFYIPGTEENRHGACTAVEGYVRPTDWCALFQPSERLEGESLDPEERFAPTQE